MKTKKSTVDSKVKKQSNDARSRKMEPLKSKEIKNQRYDLGDEEDSDEIDPDSMDDNFKGFDESFENLDDDDDDF